MVIVIITYYYKKTTSISNSNTISLILAITDLWIWKDLHKILSDY